jgi:hypothetical protein
MRALLFALSLLLVLPHAAEAKKKRKRGKAAHALKQKRTARKAEAPPVEAQRVEPRRPEPARRDASRPMVAQADDNEVPPHASGSASR